MVITKKHSFDELTKHYIFSDKSSFIWAKGDEFFRLDENGEVIFPLFQRRSMTVSFNHKIWDSFEKGEGYKMREIHLFFDTDKERNKRIRLVLSAFFLRIEEGKEVSSKHIKKANDILTF